MLFRKRNHNLVIASFAILGLLTLPALAAPQAEYTAGHVDIGVKYDANGFDLRYNFAANGVIDGTQVGSITGVDPADVYTRAANTTKLTRPSSMDWDFIGIPEDSDFWALPQSNTSGEPFLGTAGEDLDDSSNWTGDINYEVTGVTRPSGSHVSLYQTDTVGNPTAFISTESGLSDNLSVPVGSHSHYNWAFTKKGVYQMEVTASGERTSGETVQETEVFWFAVGDDAEPTDDRAYEYKYGHGHFGLNYDKNPAPDGEPLNNDGGLFPHVGIPGAGPNSDTNLPRNGPFNPADVMHIVPGSTKGDGSNLDSDIQDALGSVTDDVWVLPESSSEAADKNAPWTGPAVNPDAYAEFDDIQGDDSTPSPEGNVQWTLTHVDGPGEVALWTNDPAGNPDIWMASADGLDPVGGDDTILLEPGGLHNNMAFTELGLYNLTFQWDVEVDGDPLRESATFAFNVIPEPASVALFGVAGLALLARRRGQRA